MKQIKKGLPYHENNTTIYRCHTLASAAARWLWRQGSLSYSSSRGIAVIEEKKPVDQPQCGTKSVPTTEPTVGNEQSSQDEKPDNPDLHPQIPVLEIRGTKVFLTLESNKSE